MKLSVSLSDEDVDVIDKFVRTAGLSSRSAAIQHAIGLLRYPDLEEQYASAWAEWDASEDQQLWDQTVADGLSAPVERKPTRTKRSAARASR